MLPRTPNAALHGYQKQVIIWLKTTATKPVMHSVGKRQVSNSATLSDSVWQTDPWSLPKQEACLCKRQFSEDRAFPQLKTWNC